MNCPLDCSDWVDISPEKCREILLNTDNYQRDSFANCILYKHNNQAFIAVTDDGIKIAPNLWKIFK